MHFPLIPIRNARWRFFFLAIFPLVAHLTGSAVSSGSQRPTGPAGSPYIWPTNASRTLSSTFAETREGHFHFGIDIRTNSGEGYPCYAVEDGDVVRVKVSPYGYGKVLYLKLKDGRMAVYAHLQRFAPGVEEKVKACQYQNRIFRCHLFFEPGELSFRKGDVIAYTGSSGVGHPHLHFEMRGENSYLNPYMFGFTVADSRAPRPQRVALFPLSGDAEVNGDFQPKIFGLQRASSKHRNDYIVADIPEAYGAVGLGISGYDQADGAPNKMSFYGLDLIVDDSLCFSARYDSIGFEEVKQVELERNFRLQRRSDQVFHHLWRDANVTAQFYRSGDGVLDSRYFAPGIHDFEIVLWDYTGNSARVGGQICFQENPLYPTWERLSSRGDFLALGGASATSAQALNPANSLLQTDFYDDYVVLTLPHADRQEAVHLFLMQPYESRIPLISRKNKWIGKLPLEPWPAGVLMLELQTEDKDGRVQVDTVGWMNCPISMGGGTATSPDGCFRATFRDETVYRTLYARVSQEDPPDDPIFKTRIYRLDPFDVPIRGNVEVAISIPETEPQADKLGIYYLSKKGKWSFVDNVRGAIPGAISGATPTLETYVLIKDVDPPKLRWLAPRLITSERCPIFHLSVKDELSGVDDRRIDFEVDGQWVLMEYDPEAERIFGQSEEPLSVGDHRVEVQIRDFCGNEAHLERTLKVIRP